MKKIRLGGKCGVGKYALVDDKDFEKLCKFKWHCAKNFNYYYAQTTLRGKDNKQFSQTMHQKIIGKKDGLMTDHINRNGLDNRKENLRFVTNSENQLNSKMNCRNKSGHRGISWDKYNNRWRVCFQNNKKQKCINGIRSLEDAIKITQRVVSVNQLKGFIY